MDGRSNEFYGCFLTISKISIISHRFGGPNALKPCLL